MIISATEYQKVWNIAVLLALRQREAVADCVTAFCLFITPSALYLSYLLSFSGKQGEERQKKNKNKKFKIQIKRFQRSAKHMGLVFNIVTNIEP